MIVILRKRTGPTAARTEEQVQLKAWSDLQSRNRSPVMATNGPVPSFVSVMPAGGRTQTPRLSRPRWVVDRLGDLGEELVRQVCECWHLDKLGRAESGCVNCLLSMSVLENGVMVVTCSILHTARIQRKRVDET